MTNKRIKPNFALLMSPESLKLVHRAFPVWHAVGEVSPTDPELKSKLKALREIGRALDPNPMRCKLVIPDDHVRYLTIEVGEQSGAALIELVEQTLEGSAPYTLDEMAYDWTVGGRTVYIAAVTKVTLNEAEAFAVQNGFDPVCFVAIPQTGQFIGEPFFGLTKHAATIIAPDETPERETSAMQVVGSPTIKPATQAPAPIAADPMTAPVSPAVSPAAATPAATVSPTVTQNAAAKIVPPQKPDPIEVAPLAAPQFMSKSAPKTMAVIQAYPLRKAAVIAGLAAFLGAAGWGAWSLRSGPEAQSPAASDVAALAPAENPSTNSPSVAPPLPATQDGAATMTETHSAEPTSAIAENTAPAAAPEILPITAAQPETAAPIQTETVIAAVAETQVQTETQAEPVAPSQTPPPRVDETAMAATMRPRARPGSAEQTVATNTPAAETAARSDNPDVTQASLSTDTIPTDNAVALTPAILPATVDGVQTQDGIMVYAGKPKVTPPASFVKQFAPSPADPAPSQTPPSETAQGTDTTESTISAAVEANTEASAEATAPSEIAFAQDPALAALRPKLRPLALEASHADAVAALSPEATTDPAEDQPKLRPQARPQSIAAIAPVEPAPAASPEPNQPEARATIPSVPAEPAPAPPQQATPQATPQVAPQAAPTATIPMLQEAVRRSTRPKDRPLKINRVAQRNDQARAPVAQSQPQKPTPRGDTRTASASPDASKVRVRGNETIRPNSATPRHVASRATDKNAIKFKKVNLIGTFGTARSRQALVLLSNGKYVRVKVGDALDGGRVAAIDASELRYVKRGRNITLTMPKG